MGTQHIRVWTDRRVRPQISIRCRCGGFGCITNGFARYPPPASTKAPMGTILAQLAALPGRWCFRPLAHTALRSMRRLDGRNPPRRGGPPCPPAITDECSWSFVHGPVSKKVSAGNWAGFDFSLAIGQSPIWPLFTNPPLRGGPLCPPAPFWMSDLCAVMVQ